MKTVSRYQEDCGWRSKEELQQQILDEIKSNAPQVLTELHSLLNTYCALPTEYQHLGPVTVAPAVWSMGDLWRKWNWTQLQRASAAGDATATKLMSEMSAWAEKWIKDELYWLMTRALETLQHWRRHPPQPLDLDWVLPDGGAMYRGTMYHSPSLEESPLFNFEHRGWRFTGEPRQDWINRVDLAFTSSRDEYLAYIDRVVAEANAEEINDPVSNALRLSALPEKRRNSSWYVEGFVKYQVLDRSKRELEKEYKPRLNSIAKALKRVADDAKIKLRSEDAGRPLGSRNVRH